MAEPQGGGGTPVTTYEAILLCLRGYEVMAANYSSDCDCDEEQLTRVNRGEIMTCCWDGISLGEVHQYIETRTISLPSVGIVDGHATGPVSWEEPTRFDFDGFAYMGPFEVWEEVGGGVTAALEEIRGTYR